MGPCANMQLDLSEFYAFKVVYELTEIKQVRVPFSKLITEKKRDCKRTVYSTNSFVRHRECYLRRNSSIQYMNLVNIFNLKSIHSLNIGSLLKEGQILRTK